MAPIGSIIGAGVVPSAIGYLAEAASFSLSSTVFTLASRRIGAMKINRVRLVMAVGWITLVMIGVALMCLIA